MSLIKMSYDDYYTNYWHKRAPETRNYVVCSIAEATHVVFSEVDLYLGGADGKKFKANKVYPLYKIEDSNEYLIINDMGEAVIDFNLFMPGECLKQKCRVRTNNKIQQVAATIQPNHKVIYLSDYKIKKGVRLL
ncbi:hypothetical protein [Oceanobacillus oncorhynchi]|uniref:hypothetical protein n=1 Tax=Oceanobacillus oncorhynchi TaxID=545501 RepID=UPI0034D49373